MFEHHPNRRPRVFGALFMVTCVVLSFVGCPLQVGPECRSFHDCTLSQVCTNGWCISKEQKDVELVETGVDPNENPEAERVDEPPPQTEDFFACLPTKQSYPANKMIVVPEGTVLEVTFSYRNTSNFDWVCDAEHGVDNPRHIELVVAEDATGIRVIKNSKFHHATWVNQLRIGCFSSVDHATGRVPPGEIAVFRFMIKVPQGEHKLWVVPSLAGQIRAKHCFGQTHMWFRGEDLKCEGVATQPCERCGTQTRSCVKGRWSEWSECTQQKTCDFNATKSCTSACGKGVQLCSLDCSWGSCSVSSQGECTSGQTRPCPSTCGDGVQTCTSCRWGPCTQHEPKSCVPGETQSVSCGPNQCEVRSRLCNATCQWNDWSPCRDDFTKCWLSLYHFRTSSNAYCLGVSQSPPKTCPASSYKLVGEAFNIRSYRAPGTFEARQCSAQNDHILVPFPSSDYNILKAKGYDCSLLLGYPYYLGSGPDPSLSPWKTRCKLWRFSYPIQDEIGGHHFTKHDIVSGMKCEGARADVYTDSVCFSRSPEGCP